MAHIFPLALNKLSQAQQRRLYGSPNIAQHYHLSIGASDCRAGSGHKETSTARYLLALNAQRSLPQRNHLICER
jgi:hypothetical protein